MAEAKIKNFFLKDMLGFDENEKAPETAEQTIEEPLKSEASQQDISDKKAVMLSVIAHGSTFTGNIVSDGDVQVDGKVFGDVSADRNVMITGTVKGNITAKRVDFKTGLVTGDIAVTENIISDYGTEIDGSIAADGATIDGRVNGNITAKGDVIFKKNSYVEGNIEAATVTTEKGAVICGQVIVNKGDKGRAKKTPAAPQPETPAIDEAETPRFPEEGSLFAQK